MIATVTFTYDSRWRLILEVRSGDNPYNLAYEYDQGGNRVLKKDLLNAPISTIETTYTYDIQDAQTFGSANNRLMTYVTEEVSDTGVRTLLETTYYYYNKEGNVTRVVTEKANPGLNEPKYSATRLAYALNGKTVTFVTGETWGNGLPYDITYAREFRYDSPRQRYLNRELDPVALLSGSIIKVGSIWSDYDGDNIYGDFTVSAGTATPVRSFEPGMGTFAWMPGNPDPVPDTASTQYYHSDLIGTLRNTSDPFGTPGTLRVLTAFGERIAGPSDRYGYAGAWGYQTETFTTGGGFPFLHVGARYYDPSTGLFLQRDPIGILSGTNVYAYVRNAPTVAVDPQVALQS